MRPETFVGPDLSAVGAEVRTTMGEDALVLDHRVIREGRRSLFEIVAVRLADVEQFRRRLEPRAIPPREERGRGYRIALVGPTGAGKSTVAGRLAALEVAEGGEVGVISVVLDGGRDGRGPVELAGIPVERVGHPAEVAPAMQRLRSCALVAVDLPALNRKHPERNLVAAEILERISPDEVHLVVPAYLRTDVAVEIRDRYGRFGVTHMLLSKLDEVPGEVGVVDLAFRLDLPSRWASDGPGLAGDAHPAAPRILASLGLPLEGSEPRAAAGIR
jgi:flagellar biosynthesis protein FlhF